MRLLAPHLILAVGVSLPAMLLGACAAEEEALGPDAGLTLEPPVLKSVAPSQLSVGDPVTVLAEDLPDPAEGEVSIRLVGTYQTATGAEYDFDSELPLTVENRSVASMIFDELYFDPNQAETGTWRGTAELVVVPKGDFAPAPAPGDSELRSGQAGTVRSNQIDLSLRVGPSIIIDQLKALDGQGCADFTTATTTGQELGLSFRAIGLGQATEDNPWTFRMLWGAPDLKVRYVKEDALGGFDGSILGDALLDDTVSADAVNGTSHTLEVRKTEGDALNLNPRLGITTARITPAVEIGLNLYDEVVIGRIAAGPIEEKIGKRTASVILEVEAQDGRSLRRSLSLDIFTNFELSPAAPPVLVERFPAEVNPACACVPGGKNGIKLTYSEGSSISKQRSLNYRWDQNVASSLNFQLGSFNPVAQIGGSETWTESFGVDINESATSETHESINADKEVFPGWFGTCWRQTEEVERTVDLIYHNACGAAGVVGQAVLTDYHFTVDVATGPECPAESELPEPVSFR